MSWPSKKHCSVPGPPLSSGWRNDSCFSEFPSATKPGRPFGLMYVSLCRPPGPPNPRRAPSLPRALGLYADEAYLLGLALLIDHWLKQDSASCNNSFIQRKKDRCNKIIHNVLGQHAKRSSKIFWSKLKYIKAQNVSFFQLKLRKSRKLTECVQQATHADLHLSGK